jgi:hypothetical protein
MEMPQGNSLCSYVYLKQARISCFSFYFLSFFFYKIGQQESRTGPAQGVGLALVGRSREKDRRMNMVQKMCTHLCKCKNDTC